MNGHTEPHLFLGACICACTLCTTHNGSLTVCICRACPKDKCGTAKYGV